MNTKKMFAMGAAAVALVMGSSAMAATSATGTASATIVTPISISKTTDLSFGKISPSGSLGTVVIANNGTRSRTGGTVLVTGGTVSQAVFSISGESGLTYDVTLPTSVTLDDGASNTMTVDNFTTNIATDGTEAVGSGATTMNVGATLNVAANQTAGTYSKTFTVTVAYK